MLLDKLFNKRAAATYSSYPVGDPGLVTLFGTSSVTASGLSVTSDTAMRVSTVYACVSIISQTLAMLPLEVKRIRPDGGREIAKTHRLYKQLRHTPNKWQTSFEFRETMEVARLLRGNALAYVSSSPGRGVNALIPVNPDLVTVFSVDSKGRLKYYTTYSPPPNADEKIFYSVTIESGEQLLFSDEEMLHIKGVSHNGIIGLNPIELHREAIGLSMATEEHGARVFSNGAQIAGVLEVPGQLSDDAFQRLQKAWQSQRSGLSNVAKTAILEEGTKFSKIAMTGVDSQFLETRKYQVEDIARIFNVPLVMLGHSGDKNATYASAEQFFMSFARTTMATICKRWEESLERDLFYPSEIGNFCIDLEMDEMMRGDAAARATYLKARFEMASMTPDEIRAYEGENPSNTDAGKRFYLQSGMMPADMAGVTPGGEADDKVV